MGYAFFDFDGTISTRDSFLLFLKYIDRTRLATTCLLTLPQICLYLIGFYPNQRLKETFLKRILSGKSTRSIQHLADNFCKEIIPGIIRPQFWEKLEFHNAHNHRVVIVTATPRIILQPWCNSFGLDILGTELHLNSGKIISGKIDGLNCMGEEKVRRIHGNYKISPDQTIIYAYGDSVSDLPMLGLAQPENRFFKPFR